MAKRIWPLTVTVPAGTPIVNPVVVPWVTEDNVVDSIEILIPPGHNGQTGVRILKGDTQVLPYGASGWIIGNDYYRNFPIESPMPTTDMVVQAYNTGAYPHSFYLRVEISTLVPPAVVPMTTEAGALTTPGVIENPGALTPDALIGPGAGAALTNGDVTPEQLAETLTMT